MKEAEMEWFVVFRTFGLFAVTALAELLGCYLPLLWLTGKGSLWLLSLHPMASGRIYASYGAVYVATALGWLWVVDGIKPNGSDIIGVGLVLFGAGVIAFGHRLP
jgi:small multidrug resistance family-3 protein